MEAGAPTTPGINRYEVGSDLLDLFDGCEYLLQLGKYKIHPMKSLLKD